MVQCHAHPRSFPGGGRRAAWFTLCLSLQPVAVCGFQELAGSLQDVISQALEHIKGQETGIAALKLAGLSLEGCPEVSTQAQNMLNFLVSLFSRKKFPLKLILVTLFFADNASL